MIALAAALPGAAHAQSDLRAAMAKCRPIADLPSRAACYDRIALEDGGPRWTGRLSFTTEAFTVDRPTLIRFDSEGVIFVMYLKDAAGEVVQNIHHAGAGEGRYLIGQPGTYTLQINGAEGWRIWLEPQS
ncbi:hypothetical protein [Sphingomonas crocodyli]|nr:hypothetical protein [Sphingomonas crocodyli]